MVTITVRRLEAWAAKRSVADELLKGKAVDLAKARTVLMELSEANVDCIDVATEMRMEGERLRAALRVSQYETKAANAKIDRMRPWATTGKITIYGGIAAGGFLIYNALRP